MNKRNVTSALKAAIKNCGKSRYAIWKATGISQTSLSYFMRGKSTLRLDRVDALAEFLGLELVSKKGK